MSSPLPFPPPARGPRGPRGLALALVLGLAAAAASARPTVGLVLGGGGARGAAHIGVLEVLEQLRVPVDCVAGTSFGALVAGAWAAGVSPAEMRRAMAAADWADIFQDNPAYDELSYRNKQLLRRYLPSSESGLGSDGLTYPPGAVAGQKVKLFINELVRADRGEPAIERLPVPLSIIATDIGNGERVVFRRGSLTQAMRASMSVPGLLAPTEVDGRKLVDGGLVDNVPIREVRERCGADVVIAVNVGSPLLAPQDVGSLLTVSAQMVALLSEQNVTLSLARLRPGDIYIKPVLTGITADDFQRHAEAADRGREAAGWAADALRRLSVADPTWQRWPAAAVAAPATVIDEVRIEGLERVNPAVVSRQVRQQPGAPLDTAVLNRDLLRIYGDGWYESVDYELLSVRERSILRLTPVEKGWGPDYLRLAVNLESTLSQGATYGLRAAIHRTWLNPLGGELLASAEIGSRSALALQWHQPLQRTQRSFAQADLDVSSTSQDLYADDRRIARYDVDRASLELTLGLNLQRLGQLRAGWQATRARGKVDIGPDVLPPLSQTTGGLLVAMDLDRLDRLYFPTRGWSAQLRYLDAHRDGYSRLQAEARGALPLGEWVLGARASYVGSLHGRLPVFDAGTLGGFLNLSAFGSGQFVADTVRYGHLRAERIIGRLPIGLRGDMRLGLALEAGRVGNPYTVDARTGLLESAALYLGGETPFGPVYVGLGLGSGSSNAYLFVGTP